MENFWIYGLGFFAQSLFGARLIVQLFLSEKQGKVVSPTLFWQLSLVASFLFLIYGIIRDDLVIILGQTLSYFIYIRNLQLKDDWRRFPIVLRGILLSLPALAFAWIIFGAQHNIKEIFLKNDLSDPVIIMGAIGQLTLNFRFIYQWYHSEKSKTSMLPLGFWIMSTIASLLILQYAYTVKDPVLLVSQGMGIFVYIRNIIIHFKAKQIGQTDIMSTKK